MTDTDITADVSAAIKRGDLLVAIELARDAIEAGNDSQRLKYFYVLATARSGAIDWAERLYLDYGLDQETDIDSRTLWARLAKDRAFRAGGKTRQSLLVKASELYGAIYQETGDTFPGINAATLLAMSGDEKGADLLATEIISYDHIRSPEGYWDTATLAEALFVLRRDDEALALLEKAKSLVGDEFGSLSSTYRNLKELLDETDPTGRRTAGLKQVMDLPNVMVFTGHMFATLQDKTYADEAEVKRHIKDHLNRQNIKVAYGALACGADILFAEAVIENGCELHVILPFREQDFLEQSVFPGGNGWLERYQACRKKAVTFELATRDEYVGDPQQFAFGSQYAEGMARLRSRHIGSDAVMFALWDGVAAKGAAGTAAQVQRWQEEKGRIAILPLYRKGGLSTQSHTPVKPSKSRVMKAMLFTDFPGFTKLSEGVLPLFWDKVMGGIAEVLKDYQHAVQTQNTWGDAVHVVLNEPADASRLALAIQEKLNRLDAGQLGLERPATMRIGMHFGPVYETQDRITGRLNYFGSQVSEAARIEPVTPAGAVYVTEPFAAILEREDFKDEFECIFVGRVELAKKYGIKRMYTLVQTGEKEERKSSFATGVKRFFGAIRNNQS